MKKQTRGGPRKEKRSWGTGLFERDTDMIKKIAVIGQPVFKSRALGRGKDEPSLSFISNNSKWDEPPYDVAKFDETAARMKRLFLTGAQQL